jgi:Uma2 family endonuclease
VSVLAQIETHREAWTEETFLALPEDPRRIELLDGALLVSPSPTVRHQRLSLLVALALEGAHPTGTLVLQAVDVRVGRDRILVPDIVVVRWPRPGLKVVDADDVLLAVEIVSPGSVAADRAIKPPLYAQAGVPLYVRVEQAGPVAHLFELDGDRYRLTSSGPMLHLPDPFGLTIDLAALVAADEAE